MRTLLIPLSIIVICGMISVATRTPAWESFEDAKRPDKKNWIGWMYATHILAVAFVLLWLLGAYILQKMRTPPPTLS